VLLFRCFAAFNCLSPALDPSNIRRNKSRSGTRQQFNDIEGDEHFKVCSHCNRPVSRNINTLRNHIAAYHPDDITTPPKKRSRSVSAVPSSMNEWTASDINEAHLLLAKAVLECALPFSIVEHPAIVALFKKNITPLINYPVQKLYQPPTLTLYFRKQKIL